MLHWFQPLSFPFLVLQRKLCTTRARHFLRTRVGRLADGITFDLEVKRHRNKIGGIDGDHFVPHAILLLLHPASQHDVQERPLNGTHSVSSLWKRSEFKWECAVASGNMRMGHFICNTIHPFDHIAIFDTWMSK